MQVESSHISDVDYEDGVLTIQFKDGGTYNYFDVPAGIYQEMVSAPSVGRFFKDNVKGTFEFERIR